MICRQARPGDQFERYEQQKDRHYAKIHIVAPFIESMVPVIPYSQRSPCICIVRIGHLKEAAVHVAVLEIDLPFQKSVGHQFILILVLDRVAVWISVRIVAAHGCGRVLHPFFFSRCGSFL